MGKAGRAFCIFTPWLLTVASFVCLILLELGGWQSDSTTLNSLYLFQADFRNLSTSSASTLDNTTTLTSALQLAERDHLLSKVYQIHLWNYCYSNETSGEIQACSARHTKYYFDPVEMWGLNATNQTASSTGSASNPVTSGIATAKTNGERYENKLLGQTGADALRAYEAVATWMFIAYEVSFWTTLATVVLAVFAICSRIGSFVTWMFSVVSSLFTLGAVLTSTILFSTLVGALDGVLGPYHVKLTIGTSALIVEWLAVLFSWTATSFWLFSVCCCSGRSNPHHRSNRGGLWNAEARSGYGGEEYVRSSSSRGMRAEKSGGNYARVQSPYVGHSEPEVYGDRVPLQNYPPQASRGDAVQMGGYEPYRRS